MKKLAFMLGIIGAFIVGGYIFLNSQIESIKQEAQMQQDTEKNTVDPEAPLPGEEIVYTIDEVSLHNEKDDCWLIISENIYDVTGYIKEKKHPGGEVLVEGCGTDATELFETRPMGSRTPHSEEARGFLSEFQIGIIRETPLEE